MTQSSHKAHEKIQSKSEALRQRILHALSECSMTCARLELILYLRHQTCSARLVELHERGLIKPVSEQDGQTEWAVSMPHEIEAVKASVEAERKKKWVKQGLQLFKDMPQDLREQLKQMAA